MSKMYTFKNAVYDILSYNPSINEEELKNLINEKIQSEIIPEILLKIKIPNTLSRYELKKLEFLEKRRGSTNIYSIINKKLKKDYIYNEIKYIKTQLNNESINTITESKNNFNINKNYYYDPIIFTDKTQQLYKEKNSSITIKSPQDMLVDPYFLIGYKKPNFVSLIFDDRINKLLLNEPPFQEYILKIEKSLRNSNYLNFIKEININYKQDVEFMNWDKIIVKITPVSEDFNNVIKLWDKIQSTVRFNMVKIINEKNDASKNNLFKTYLNKTFFHIKMDADDDD